MRQAPSVSFFRRLVCGRPALDEGDPADLGTAFGLEASLGPVSSYPPVDDALGSGREPDDDGPMGWLGRRLRRAR